MRPGRALEERPSLPWLCLVVAVALAATCAAAHAQQDIGGQQNPWEDYDGPQGAVPPGGEEGSDEEAGGRRAPPDSETFPDVWCGYIDDPETRDVCWSAYRAGLAYYETGLEHRTRVFRWQHFSTKVIFVVVLVLVALGIYFAWVQFKRGDTHEKHELEVGLKGIKVNSSVLGLVILALSLAFLYLYLVYVYPIHELI